MAKKKAAARRRRMPTFKERRAMGLTLGQLRRDALAAKASGDLTRGMLEEDVADVLLERAMEARAAAWAPAAMPRGVDWQKFIQWVIDVLIPAIIKIIALF